MSRREGNLGRGVGFDSQDPYDQNLRFSPSTYLLTKNSILYLKTLQLVQVALILIYGWLTLMALFIMMKLTSTEVDDLFLR